jgi:hypothetical protein
MGQPLTAGLIKKNICISFCICIILAAAAVSKQRATHSSLIRQIEQHSANKEKVLTLLKAAPQLQITKLFGCNFTDTWRRVLIDGRFEGTDKTQLLETALRGCSDSHNELARALHSLLKSHRRLFASGKNQEIMIRSADDPAFEPFGAHMSPAQAIKRMTTGSDEQVQAFKTIFETGQNTRGYIHKLECHAEAVEFIYAATDIVYGVMLPSELRFSPNRIVAEPTDVQMFYVRAGNVIALHPYVLHSGSLSVEPDRSFSIIIYKKPAQAADLAVPLPEAWQNHRQLIKLSDIDKYYLTLEELHTPDLKNNHGLIASKRPVWLPTWQ